MENKNRLKNYKRLEFSSEDASNAKEELFRVLEKHEQDLKEKMTEYITHSYRNSMMEIERRKLAERAGISQPRIDHYLRSMLYYSFNKLHKGDKLKAYELLQEVKEAIL